MRSIFLIAAGALFALLILTGVPSTEVVEAAAPAPVAPVMDTLADINVTATEHYTNASCTYVRVQLKRKDGTTHDVRLNIDSAQGLHFFPEPVNDPFGD
jgi:hypothetical protein